MPRRQSERRLRPAFADWPAADQAAWAGLFREGDVLDGAGPARHWAPVTRSMNQASYGYWLGWLEGQGALHPDVAPGTRATPEAVRGYFEALRGRAAPVTAATLLARLRTTLRLMQPEVDWRWLAELGARVNRWAEPSVDRTAIIRPIEEIHAACVRELDRLAATPLTTRRDRVDYRDALIALTLCAAPVRLRNLASIEIGRHLLPLGDRWELRFRGDETKTGGRLSFELPRHDAPYLARYLERVRPGFEPAPGCRRLWLTSEGAPLRDHAVRRRVVLLTRRLLGTAINPHSFRACAATSFALRSPAMARQAAPLLGHRDFRTTEKHYVKASQLEASRGVNAVLGDLRGERRKREKSG